MVHLDALVAPVFGWDEDSGEDPPWHAKTRDTLLWRGSTTGSLFVERNEAKSNFSQRARLVRLAEGNSNMDIAFAGEAIQCEEENYCMRLEQMYVFDDWQKSEEANEYCYVIDVS